MPAASPLKNPVKVSLLLRRRLRELKRTPRELAEAVKVSEDYMADLVAGRRPPPAPGRRRLYTPTTQLLPARPQRPPPPAPAPRASGAGGGPPPSPGGRPGRGAGGPGGAARG